MTCLLLIRTKPELSTASAKPAESQANGWLLLAFVATMVPMVLANLAIAYTYQPNHPDALSWQLPRALYYLGQNSLWHFDAADLRQIYLPFNFNLLQLFGLIYSPPLQCLNFFNLLAWIISGLAIYRLCRQLSGGVNVSLLTTWLALTAPLILTGATSSIPELASGAALACAGVFTLKWQRSCQQRHAVLAGLALGLAAGSSLLLFFPHTDFDIRNRVALAETSEPHAQLGPADDAHHGHQCTLCGHQSGGDRKITRTDVYIRTMPFSWLERISATPTDSQPQCGYAFRNARRRFAIQASRLLDGWSGLNPWRVLGRGK